MLRLSYPLTLRFANAIEGVSNANITCQYHASITLRAPKHIFDLDTKSFESVKILL